MKKGIKNLKHNISYQLSIKGIVCAFLLLITTTSFATTTSSIFDLMNYQEVVEVSMTGDFETLRANRRSGEGQIVALSFIDAAGTEQTWNTSITLRGNYRRMRCTAMPPMKLNFKKSELKAAGLAKFDDMKLVTQCMEEDEDSKALVLKEYLTYKLYNELTPASFKVQLLKITYIDTHTGSTTKQWGFLIEDTAQLRARIAAEKSEQRVGLLAADFHSESFYMTAVFQYMIGNGDWDARISKNTKILNKDGKYLAIPYDFDFSGLVDASYAIPNGNYEMASVQERIYMGFEQDLAHLDATLAFFHTKKKKLRDTVKAFKVLRAKDRRAVLTYLESFFDTSDVIIYKAKKTLSVSTVEAQID